MEIFHIKMDGKSTNIFEIWKQFEVLTENTVKEIDNAIEEHSLKLDVLYDNLLQSAQRNTLNVPKKKMSKRKSKTKNGEAGHNEQSFQQLATIPPLHKTKIEAFVLAVDKIKGVRESAAISSSTRAAQSTLSTFMDIDPIDCPAGNSTFVADKKLMKNNNEYLSPQMLPENMTYIKPVNSNQTHDKSNIGNKTKKRKKKSKNINLIPEELPLSVNDSNSHHLSAKSGTKKTSELNLINNKQREKLGYIDINIVEQSSQYMTRTVKRKLQEENHIDAKKTNVVHVPLEKQISTPLKPVEDTLQTLHQVRENEAEKRKEMYLRSKADQKKFDDQHLKAAKQREEQLKLVEKKIKKAAEKKMKKNEKQKEKELMMKEKALKKRKEAELRVAQISAKRKQAEEAKLLKTPKAEMERKLIENEIKKKTELKPEKSKSVHPEDVTSNLPTPSVPKVPKSKAEKVRINRNDYGLNDLSARDSTEDELEPKKPIPSWAKRENRKAVLELQYHVDSTERDLFFDCPKSVSLKEMFKGFNICDRQRTSSAVWNTPPRYSDYLRRE